MSEAAIRGVRLGKVLLKILQISQENTCIGLSGVLLWNLRNFIEQHFKEHLKLKLLEGLTDKF